VPEGTFVSMYVATDSSASLCCREGINILTVNVMFLTGLVWTLNSFGLLEFALSGNHDCTCHHAPQLPPWISRSCLCGRRA